MKAVKRQEGEVGGTSQLRRGLKSVDFHAAVPLADRLAEALLECEYCGLGDPTQPGAEMHGRVRVEAERG